MLVSRPKISAKRRFHSLDGWRGVCALLVALFHIPIKVSFFSLGFFKDSYLFVDFFFVLSGFVIAHAYSSVSGSANWFAFMLKRFGRLWPLHVSVLAVFVGINIIRLSLYGWYGLSQRVNASWSGLGLSAFEHVTFLQAATFLPQPAGVLTNVPSWSISTEFWTYLLFALITAGFGKNVTIIKCLVALFSAFMVVHFSANGLDVDNWLGFFRCFFGFFLGQLGLFGLHLAAA